ncbi:hypothetical protein Salat_2535400 [Sesamum alatum]|uniref:Uncharacterized protein n=1 Tax=Sesamum alatum TaxID=300844 RepID=A0AAE1XS47_9LAMI|nr:hypothetical protein Salat_2535400 [Sesamum alatum]
MHSAKNRIEGPACTNRTRLQPPLRQLLNQLLSLLKPKGKQLVPTPQLSSTVGVASGSRGTGVEPVAKGACEDPNSSKKHKTKHKYKRKDSRSSKSSKKSKSCLVEKAKKKATVEADEVECLKFLKEMQEWWKANREELRSPSQRAVEMVGDRRIPDWVISTQSSILQSHLGQDSWELFKIILCFYFWPQFIPECSVFRPDKKILIAENTKLKYEIEALKAQITEAKASSDEKISHLEAKLHECVAIGFGGRYLEYDDHKVILVATCVEGTCNFLKSSALGIPLEVRIARFALDGFDLCHLQIKTLVGFVKGLDHNRLDPTLNATSKFLMWVIPSLPTQTNLVC